MLGINDPVIYIGYLLSILSLIACIVYGILNWNKGMGISSDEIQEDLDWEDKDEELQRDI